MADRTLTSANSILMLGVVGLFNSPQKIEGYGTEDAFDSDAVEPAQVVVGVDKKVSFGYVPVVKNLNITLQADSPSVDFFETWWATQDAQSEVFPANGVLSIPATQRKYTLTKGVLMNYVPIPPGKKILQPQKFSIAFGSIRPAPV